MTVVRIAEGMFRVEIDGRAEIVYVAGTAGARWAFWNGRVFTGPLGEKVEARASRPRGDAHQSLSAPMPATVLKVLVTNGAHVTKGETVVILEAMKMELPLRSASEAVVTAVHCREGELVQPETVLIELS